MRGGEAIDMIKSILFKLLWLKSWMGNKNYDAAGPQNLMMNSFGLSLGLQVKTLTIYNEYQYKKSFTRNVPCLQILLWQKDFIALVEKYSCATNNVCCLC